MLLPQDGDAERRDFAQLACVHVMQRTDELFCCICHRLMASLLVVQAFCASLSRINASQSVRDCVLLCIAATVSAVQ